MNCTEFINTLQPGAKHMLLEVAYRVYADGNTYEMICNEIGIDTDEWRDLFEKIEAYWKGKT